MLRGVANRIPQAPRGHESEFLGNGTQASDFAAQGRALVDAWWVDFNHERNNKLPAQNDDMVL